MIDQRLPRYQWGQHVKVAVTFSATAPFPKRRPTGSLSVPATSARPLTSERTQDVNLTIYLVEFGERLVVGCLEEVSHSAFEEPSAMNAAAMR